MVVLMELGAQQKFRVGGSYRIDSGTLSKDPRTVWQGYGNTKNEPGRYSIHIRGHQPYVAIGKMAPGIEALFRKNYDVSPEEFDEIHTDMEKKLNPLTGKAQGTFWSEEGMFE